MRLKGVIDGKQVHIPVLFIVKNGGRRRLDWPNFGSRFKYSRCRGLVKPI